MRYTEIHHTDIPRMVYRGYAKSYLTWVFFYCSRTSQSCFTGSDKLNIFITTSTF